MKATTGRWTLAMLAAAFAFLVGCDEIPQDQRKPFAGDAEVKLQNHAFKGDKARFDEALAQRAAHSDDYRVVGGAKP